MALRKSQLYSSLWSSCDELRGGMDASQYKDYVLTLLFMKYVSDKYASKQYQPIEVPEGGSFADMVKLKGKKEIGDKINKIIGKLAEANDLKNVIDVADFNDEDKLGRGKEMQDRLSKLVAIFDALDFSTNRADGDDLLGDAYEYLMRHFATESGKSKGQFYTPAEVARIMAKIVGVGPHTQPHQTVYDPTCGSGSLLLKVADEAPNGISIYGQENDVATWALAKMNMILHNHPGAELWRGNTLAAPYWKNEANALQTFDYAVANPPFSAKAWTSGFNPEADEHNRFEYGVPPAKNGDYAFLLHVISSLKSKGKGAVILPHGVLFRGNAEASIRRNLIRRGLIKGIIGLPANLFFGTGIPACIVVVDKEYATSRSGIFMIDASKGFMKDGNKNRLRAQDIHKIVDVFNNQTEVPRYARMVPMAEIASPEHDYNLNIPRYINSAEPEDLHDLSAHLQGGIPNRDLDDLAHFWEVFPSLRGDLFKDADRPGYSLTRIEGQQVNGLIKKHEEFKAYAASVGDVFDKWRADHELRLKDLQVGNNPKELINILAESMLASFTGLPLLNRYDVYQDLMDYWADVMQDDVYLIASDGWMEAAKPRPIINDQERKIKEAPDLVVKRKKYKMDLIPPARIVHRYFQDEQTAIEQLISQQEETSRELEEYTEEHGGEDGLLAEAANDKGKITKASLKAGIKQASEEDDNNNELVALARCLALVETESKAAKTVKEAQAKLDAKVLKQYSLLDETAVKELVVDDKWLAYLSGSVDDELQRVIQVLAMRVRELDERYAHSLPELSDEVEELGAKVAGHLKKMGLSWN